MEAVRWLLTFFAIMAVAVTMTTVWYIAVIERADNSEISTISPDSQKTVANSIEQQANQHSNGVDSVQQEDRPPADASEGVPSHIREFIEREKVPEFTGASVSYSYAEDFYLFSVSIFGQIGCENCASGRIYGLSYKEKVGWIKLFIPQGFLRRGVDVQREHLHFYVLEETDDFLYSERLLESLPPINARLAYFTFIVQQERTSIDGLRNIAFVLQRDQDSIEREVAEALLENPLVQRDREALALIGSIESASYSIPAHKARRLLQELPA